ncbi:TetR/AcrR family transcriptional regulator [Candidatus Poribacteria bacterium]|nr:TetR/AcrR family transcriptional regulator [Candidatus Poribacteria bacterium]
MRITKDNKEKTREKILDVAKQLFLKNGFEATTTRDIAHSSRIATGTLFNYFPNKDELAMTMIVDAITEGEKDYYKYHSGKEDFSEDIFILISSELRHLRPYRNFIGQVFESSMSIFKKNSNINSGEKIKMQHLEIVHQIIINHKYNHIPDFIISNLYWSLYLSILAFWSKDNSYYQEETLALLDYSLKIFTQTIANEKNEPQRTQSGRTIKVF